MTQGFDEWFDKEYSNYGNSYKKTYDEKHDIYGSQFVDERYDAYKAGQQSKQADVDELIDTIKTSSESEMYLFDELQKVKGERDELQKRIDVLTRKVNEMAHIFLDDLEEILKGDQL